MLKTDISDTSFTTIVARLKMVFRGAPELFAFLNLSKYLILCSTEQHNNFPTIAVFFFNILGWSIPLNKMLSILAQNGFANSLLLCVGLRVYYWISMRQLLLTRLAGISMSVSAVGGKCADLGRKWVCSYGVLVIILTCWRLEIQLGAHGCCLIHKSAVCNYIPLLRFSVCCRMTKIDLIWIDIKNVYEIFCHPFVHLLDFTSVTLICQFRLPHHFINQVLL